MSPTVGADHPDRAHAADRWKAVRAGLLTALVYFAVSRYVLVLNDPVNIGAGFWPGAGVTVSALLLSPRAHWPAILVGVGLAEIGNDVLGGFGLVPSLLWALGNMVEPLLVATLVRRWRADGFGSVRETLLFAVAALSMPIVGGLIGVRGTLATGSDQAYLLLAAKWAVGDGLGIITVAPTVLLLTRREHRSLLRQPEAVASLGAVAAVSLLVFQTWPQAWTATLPYLALPPLVWAAIRLHVVGAAVATALTAQIANAMTAFGYGPFASVAGGSREAVVLLQLFIATVTVTVLVLGSRTSEKDVAERSSADASRRAEQARALVRLGQVALEANAHPALWQAAEPELDRAAHPHHLRLVVGGARLTDVIGDTVARTSGGAGTAWAFGLELASDTGPLTPEDVWILYSARSLLESAGRRIEAERAYADSIDELRVAVSEREKLLSTVAHELRSPLSAIVGFSELLIARESDLMERQATAIEAIHRNGRHMLELITDMLTRARARGETLTPEPVTVDLVTFAEQLLEDLGYHDVEVVVARQGDHLATVDLGHLRQALTNLLTNAHRYGADPVRVEVTAADGMEHVAVVDHGTGVDADFVPHLFNEFAQAARRTSASTSLGIGLALARSLMRSNGGDITYGPADGAGARFVITVPTATNEEPADVDGTASRAPAEA